MPRHEGICSLRGNMRDESISARQRWRYISLLNTTAYARAHIAQRRSAEPISYSIIFAHAAAAARAEQKHHIIIWRRKQ